MRQSRPVRSGLLHYELDFDGITRSSLVYVPSQLPEPAPLLLVLHGGGGNPMAMARKTRFHQIAEKEGFLVVYPAGTGPKPRRLNWNAGGAEPRGWPEQHHIDDVGFLRTLIQQLTNEFSIDLQRIYATGMSKGGMMAYRLAREAPDLVAAIAVVGATMVSDREGESGKVAVMHVHGASDQNVPIRGGGGRGGFSFSRAPWPAVKDGLEYWRSVNDCADEEVEDEGDPEVHHFHSEASNGAADVDFYVIDRCGHTWPGAPPKLWKRVFGFRADKRFDASPRIWEFLRDKRKSLVSA